MTQSQPDRKTLRQRVAIWLIHTGYRMFGPRNTAGLTVNPRGKWQAIKL